MAAISVIPKRVNEKFEIVLRYYAPDLQTGETLTVCTSTFQTGLTKIGLPTIAGNEITQWLEGGTSGSEYTVTFLTTVSTGRKLEHVVIIDVDD